MTAWTFDLADLGTPSTFCIPAAVPPAGAGSLLVYAVACRLAGRPHRLQRMVLLTPAGFHVKFPKASFVWEG